MSKLRNLVGEMFGNLLVLSRAPNRGKQTMWSCKCQNCQSVTDVFGTNLVTGKSKNCNSCGRKIGGSRCVIHGGSKRFGGEKPTRIYLCWQGIRDRCLNPNSTFFHHYGGRGITICPRWLTGENGVHPFVCFKEDMGEMPAKMEIDRIDVNGNYEPSNCRWATHRQQARNVRRSIFIEAFGQRRHIKEWAEVTGIKYHTLFHRYKSGYTPEQILTKAVNSTHRNSVTKYQEEIVR